MFCPINWCFLIFLQFQQWERVFKPSCLAAILYCSSTICSRLPVSLSLWRRAKWRGKTMPRGCQEMTAAFFSPFFARLLFRLFTLTVCLALAVFLKKWRSLTVSVLSTRFGFITSVIMRNTVGIVLLATVVILSTQEQVLGLYYKRFIHFYKVLRP